MTSRSSLRDSSLTRKIELLRYFLQEQTDPVTFYERVACDAVSELSDPLNGRRVLDLGCGPGHYSRALRARGAQVVPVDLDPREFRLPGGPPGDEVVASGADLPFSSGAFDAALCSNVLEHVSDPSAVLDEVERVVRGGGWIWLSWTNWLSPWGGHEISPFHYLGPTIGLKVARRFRGEPKNIPGVSLYPLSIGAVLRALKARPAFRVRSIVPRYYPSQTWIMKLPVIREFLAWNCLVILDKIDTYSDSEVAPTVGAPRFT